VTLPPFAEAVAALTSVLDQLGIAYLVGGSVASLVHGEVRTTQDVDLVVDLAPQRLGPLAAALQAQFLADVELLRVCLRQRIASNIVHRSTGLKLDLFPLRDRPFSREELARAVRVEIAPGCGVRVATAEDCALTKLEWFRKGGEVSERQWRDVQGVLRLQASRLDRAYLRRWAPELGIDDLLQRALNEAGLA